LGFRYPQLQAHDGCPCRRTETPARTDCRHHRAGGEDLHGQGGQQVDEAGHRGCAVPGPRLRAEPPEPARPRPRVSGEVRWCGKDQGTYHTLRAQDVALPRLPSGNTGRGRFHPLRGDRHAGTDERFQGLCRERVQAAAGTPRLLYSPHAHQPQAEAAFRHDRHQHHEPALHLPALVQEDEVFRQRGLCALRL